MPTRGNLAKRSIGIATICACLAALAVGLLPSSGSALLDCNSTGGGCPSNVPPGVSAGAGGGSSSAASSKNAKFYDATVNGSTCTGVGGTAGGVHGTARSTLATPSTVSIKVRRLSHSTSYDVNFIDATCVVHPIGTLTTDGHGRGSGTYNFFGTPYSGHGNFTLVPNPGPGDSFQTKDIAF